MAYTIRNSSIRLVWPGRNGYVCVGAPVRPSSWWNDPSAPSSRRYLVSWDQDRWQTYAWYEIIDPLDQPGDVWVKLSFFAAVVAAQQELAQARSRLVRLTW